MTQYAQAKKAEKVRVVTSLQLAEKAQLQAEKAQLQAERQAEKAQLQERPTRQSNGRTAGWSKKESPKIEVKLRKSIFFKIRTW